MTDPQTGFAEPLAPAEIPPPPSGVRKADSFFAPLAIFVCVYVAVFLLLAWSGFGEAQWAALVSVALATAATAGAWERGGWNLGLAARPAVVLRELAAGTAIAVLIVGTADALILLTTGMRRSPGTGFPAAEMLAVFIPAVLHEELLFRGYLYQKLREWRRAAAVLISSTLFAVLHLGNSGITPIAVANIFLGGVLLALAYERRCRLWLPIGIHLAWNTLSGPVLGYEVSGYVAGASVFRTAGGGPELITGGGFGIEGSVYMTLAESVAVWALWRRKD